MVGGVERGGKGYAGIRDVSRSVFAAGRAKENDLSERTHCPCDDLFVTPSGDFYHCGCQKTLLGNILTDAIPDANMENLGECESTL